MATASPDLRDNARRVVDRIADTDIGVLILVQDQNMKPTAFPLGLNMAGRFQALAWMIQTLAKELTGPVGAKMAAAGDQVKAVADQVTIASAKWQHLANENASFEVPADTTVRYGQGDKWVTKIVSGKGVANNATFGDPCPGIVKVCERLA